MNYAMMLLLSFAVGIMVVVQGGLNSKLGTLLNSPLLGTSVALSISAFFTLIAVFVSVKEYPNFHQLKAVPPYLWVTGAVFSFIAVSLFYYLIPKLGIATAVTFGLCGQIAFSMIAAHFGCFSLPEEPLTLKKVFGVFMLIGGVFLSKF